MRSADNELAGGIDKILDFTVEQGLYLIRGNGADNTRYKYFLYVRFYLSQHLFISFKLGLDCCVLRSDELIVLGRNNDGIDAYGFAVVIVLNGHLTFGVGTQIGHLLALAADIGQNTQYAV